ncbi:hypothetical protein BDN71DRAFT_1444889 [Pleurotus eryngii]|uniref:Uncharacterized protein n=1 Tax=Pleurotus eryngii TaxID=5323 RepID=A0A9P6A0K4_PLEER|nr:hypothetical protein BDN71DRAFT_1444889 [Pleurotus eryngii]
MTSTARGMHPAGEGSSGCVELELASMEEKESRSLSYELGRWNLRLAMGPLLP